MPTKNFERLIKDGTLDKLEPNFLARLFDVIAACEARGARYIATSGYRSYGEQMLDWAKGRTLPGAIVTRAKGGQSAHNFGLAVDFARDLDPNTAKVETKWEDGEFDILIEEAERHGLHSGKGYRDRPHIAHPAYITAGEMKPLDREYGKAVSEGLPPLAVLKRVWKNCIPLLPR